MTENHSTEFPEPSKAAIAALAPTGVLRSAINMSNFLLVTGVDADGAPQGVSPDMAQALARKLGVPVEYRPYASPGEVTDDAESGKWDICNIGAEPARAVNISFTSAYCEITCTYLVPARSCATSISDIDQPGVRIASATRAAYDLWLSANLEHGELVGAQGLDGSYDTFVSQDLDALAGLTPRLLADASRLPGSRILTDSFTTIQQSIGTPRSRPSAGVEYLSKFVAAAVSTGFVTTLISTHRIQGLTVPTPTPTPPE